MTIYFNELIKLSCDGRFQDALPVVSGKALLRSPLCGDRVEIQVALDASRVSKLTHHVKGCVLCKAAATLACQYGQGNDLAALIDLAEVVSKILKGCSNIPAEFNELRVFEPVSAHASRHGCVMLPFRAVVEAVRGACQSRSGVRNTMASDRIVRSAT